MRPKLLYSTFRRNDLPAWRCPTCLNETLEIVPESFKIAETSETATCRDELWFDEEMAKGVFSCLLRCSRQACREHVALSGQVISLETFNDEMTERWYESGYRPIHFYPPLPLFQPPDKCPEEIFDMLAEISALIPAHRASAVNIMRTVLEIMLDSIGVPREKTELNKKGKKIRLTTHERICDYSAMLEPKNEAFMALKWLGNHGSHGGSKVTRSAIDDACVVIEDLIEFIFSESPDVKENIARINYAYAPK
ncbi:TPA: DUF4145 domain-containing protein [Serratia marcescens]|nr:DUF4145 domain-containing protein [Serratia marcescens]HEI9763386.1 DUF4145 domain-containing protein [Serratia marcescens]